MNKTQDLEVFSMVLKHMVHGPCKCDRCLHETKRCTKGFLKSFQDQSTMDQDGNPLYRRRNNERSFEKHPFFFNNSHVVPYKLQL